MRHASCKFAASLLAVTLLAGPAAADDAKNYPGIACLANGASTIDIERPTTGRATNLTTGQLTFICPAVKDFGSIAGGKAYVIDRSTSASVNCTLRSAQPLTTAQWTSNDLTGTAFADSVPTPLSFTHLDADDDGYYLMSCLVPGVVGTARSGVVMYQITEND